MGIGDLTEFESRLLKWISVSDFVEVAWSTKRAADAFKVEEKMSTRPSLLNIES